MREDREAIRDFILRNVGEHTDDIVPLMVDSYGFSRQRAHYYLSKEVERGTLIRIGRTRATRYFLVGGNHISFSVELKEGVEEYEIWATYIKPMMSKYSDNVRRTCAYGFTEMLNNAIDHSDGTTAYINFRAENEVLSFTIMDNGVGIFQKIKDALTLTSAREAILHLSKGKFTTDPTKHSGEGIFFTSRIFDNFSILSDDMYYTFDKRDWLMSSEIPETFGRGTEIHMELSADSTVTPKEVMDKFSDSEIGFQKTVVAVALSADPKDPHVSRSQAKRLMMGLEKFRNVVLDFKGVESVGQAFVDEVFRVFQNENPAIVIQYVNATKEVEEMIERGKATAQRGNNT